MGEIVEFTSNGGSSRGYVAVPGSGEGIPLLVIQEWWGLVPHIEDVCDRFAAEGFTALAPDLYHGETTTEPDEAGKLMMALNMDQAVKDMTGAIAELQRRTDRTDDGKIGVTGFCMGGGLALKISCDRPAAVGAVVPWYGLIPWEGAQPDWSTLQAPVLGHYAENDGFFGPDQVAGLRSTLDEAGATAELKVHPGVDHAFFNDTRPEVYDEATARACFTETVDFLKSHLASA